MANRPTMKRRDRLRRALTENLPLKVLALVFATMLWAWVQADQVVTARTRAGVTYLWPEGLVRTRQVPNTLVVTVSGPQGVVRRIRRGTLSLTVDLRDSEAGPVSVDFSQIEVVGLPGGVDVVQISPPAVDFDLEKALTKEVEVRPTIIGEPARGHVLDSVHSVPPTVHITGPQSRVQELAQVPTDVVNIAGLTRDKAITASLAIPDPVLEPAEGEPTHVQVIVKIRPVIAERTFQPVPVRVDADGWVVEPSEVQVTVRGPEAKLQKIPVDGVRVVLTPEDIAEGDAAAHRIRTLRWLPDETGEVHVATGDSDTTPDDIEIIQVKPSRFTLEAAP